jgi:sugar phosphate isomerase/epimerase
MASALAEQLTACQRLGLTGIELRTVNRRGLHEHTSTEVAEYARRVADSGLSVPVVDTPIGGWATTIGTPMAGELELLHRYADIAHRFASRHLRVMSYPNDGRLTEQWRDLALARMRELVQAAVQHDIVLLHENCHGWAAAGPRETRELLREVDSPNLRLLFDLGNGIAYGYSALDFLREVLPWVDHIHVKDGLTTATGPAYAIPGHGQAQLAGCLRLLQEAGFHGWYSLEPHVALIPHLSVTAASEEVLIAGFTACLEGFREIWDHSMEREDA